MAMDKLKFDDRFFESHTMSFRVPADDPKVADLVEDAILEYEGKRFYISEIIEERDETEAWYNVTAEISWMRLADIRRPGTFKLTARRPFRGLDAILDLAPGWRLGEFTDDSELYSMEAVDASVLDLIWQWAKITSNEVSFDTDIQTVNFVPQVGANRGLTFRYGRNLKQIKRTVNPPTATRLYPYGRNGMSIKGVNGGRQYLEDYSFYTAQGLTLDEAKALYRKDAIWADDSFIKATDLRYAAIVRLQSLSQPNVLYQAKVVDLSEILGRPEFNFGCGDTVYVYDEILGLSLNARVSRRVHYPAAPWDDEIELEFNPIQLPDPNSSSARANTTKEWELFESRNRASDKVILQYTSIIHRLYLSTSEDAEWIVACKIKGVGVGTSVVTFTFMDDTNGTPIWTDEVLSLTDGEEFEINWTYAEKEIPVDNYALVVRAQSDTVGAGATITEEDTAFWVLARGTTEPGNTEATSVTYTYTGAVQKFVVPEGVTEVTIEATGARGSYGTLATTSDVPGSGMTLTATFPVTELTTYDVYVGGTNVAIGNQSGGWPDGGDAGWTTFGAASGYAGGGSSSVRLEGDTFANSLIVSAGGGGVAENGSPGGDAGYPNGVDGETLYGTDRQGRGGTQSAGGVGGTGGASNGGDGAFGEGGDGGKHSSATSYYAGGGGGGWYGGGGGSGPHALGTGGGGGGGGGGSGRVGPTGYDVEIEEGTNTLGDGGWVTISWELPEE